MIEQYSKVHLEDPNYGNTSVIKNNYHYIKCLFNLIKPRNFIDYGCGKGVLSDTLSKEFKVKSYKYDPAISKYSVLPESQFDILINTDVLEHIPESDLASIINKMCSLSNISIFVIHLGLANKILPNGENAHCTIKSPNEWNSILLNHYSNVINIEHHHPKRTIFVCSNKQLDLTPCLDTLNYIKLWKEALQSYPSKAEIAQYSSKFSVRFRQAIMLLFGKEFYLKHRAFFRKHIIPKELL